MATGLAFGWQVENANGTPVSGAKVYFYAPGTTTPRTTYTDQALTVPAANPVVADSAGWFLTYISSEMAYDVVIKSADDSITYQERRVASNISGAQPVDATLTAIAGLTVGSGDYIEATGTDTFRARKLQVATYAALTAIPAASRFDDMLVYVASRTRDNDGAEGNWRFDASSTETANDATVLAPDAGTGRWIRQQDAATVWVEQFGADNTGAADSSAAFKSAWLHCLKQGGGVVNIGAGTFKWENYQEFAFLVRSGLAGAATGYKGAGDGNNQATSSGAQISYKGGVSFRGRGQGTGDSIFNDDGATIIEFDVETGPALRIISVTNLLFSDIAFRNIADLSASGGKCIHITSYDSPVETTFSVIFDRCAFLDDSYEVDNANTGGVEDALVVAENCKFVVFRNCGAFKQSNFIRIGGAAADNASALVSGDASNIVFENTFIAGDVKYVRARALEFTGCEFWPLDSTNPISSGASNLAGIIKPEDDGFFDTITLNNCKCSFDGNDTRVFLETVTGTNAGNIIVNGGLYGDYLTIFEHNGAGDLVLNGPVFRQTGSGQADINLGSTFTGRLYDHSNPDLTIGNSGTHIDDDRTSTTRAGALLYAETGIAGTTPFAANQTFYTIATGTVQFDGRAALASYAVTITNGAQDNIRYMARLTINGNVIAGSAVALNLDAGETSSLVLSAFPLPVSAVAQGLRTVLVEVMQNSSATTDPGTIRNGQASAGSFGNSYVAITPAAFT